MVVSTVSTKGAVVIPKEIRLKYGIEPGMQVAIAEVNGNLQIFPLPKNPISAARGILKKKDKKSLTDILLEERQKDLMDEEVEFRDFGEVKK